jgi:peptidoglycan/LPS O-acetylase OafA/YrhL
MSIFFKGLNELRGLAALAVVFHHIELYKHRENIGSLFDGYGYSFIEGLGKNGVYLFFVLSGFLITYLLLTELKLKGDIDAFKFYVRRVLRIWPLYYLITILSFFVFPFIVTHFGMAEGSRYHTLASSLHEDFGWRLFLFLMFLPNLASILFKAVPGAAQSWSVGVEEQFYILWPQLLKRFKNKVLMLLIGVIVVKFSLYYASILGSRSVPQLKTVVSFLQSFNIELMAMGGIGAYLLIHGRLERVYAWLPRFANAFFVLTSLVMLWFSMHYLLLSFFFLMLILLNINDKHTFFRGKFFTFVGDISYGVYMYHPLVMFFVFTGVQYVFGNENLVLFNGLIYVLIFGFTILISYLSFRYFESFFLRQKEKFIVVASGKKVTP